MRPLKDFRNIENLMKEVEVAESKIARYESLKGLKNLLKEKKKKNVDTKKLEALSKGC
jgi:hypothetical protein